MPNTESPEIEEKQADEILVAGIRFKGKYSDSGKVFPQLCRKMGRYIAGKPLNLYYDCKYKEENADIECCVPIKQPKKEMSGIDVHSLPGGRCVSLVHQGPYEELGRSYDKIRAYLKEKGCQPIAPIREIYLKGPGMFFRGNPQKYRTEIQFLIEDSFSS